MLKIVGVICFEGSFLHGCICSIILHLTFRHFCSYPKMLHQGQGSHPVQFAAETWPMGKAGEHRRLRHRRSGVSVDNKPTTESDFELISSFIYVYIMYIHVFMYKHKNKLFKQKHGPVWPFLRFSCCVGGNSKSFGLFRLFLCFN